jgi:hypothetical protein
VKHLSLEQCKKLKEIGFPQGTTNTLWYHHEDEIGDIRTDLYTDNEIENLYADTHIDAWDCPTLEELIEWLGDDIWSLLRKEPGSSFVAHNAYGALKGEGATPLEACYNLAIAVKSPDENPA